jgi:hypothetical protein
VGKIVAHVNMKGGAKKQADSSSLFDWLFTAALVSGAAYGGYKAYKWYKK